MSVFPAADVAVISLGWLGAVFGIGLFGSEMLERLLGRGDTRAAEESPSPDDDEDPFEAFEDEWDDDWLEADDAGSAGADLEPRLDELEEELERLSSTVSTVRSENEAIAGSVEEVEDNVRKLLEIYEVVSREANPFVDEADPGGVAESGAGVATGADDPVAEVAEDLGLGDGADLFEGGEAAGGIEPEASSGAEEAMTFEDLKAEYHSGEPDGRSDPAGEAAAAPDPRAAPDGEPASPADGARPADGSAAADQPVEPPEGADDGPPNSPDGGTAAVGAEGAKPYLRQLPEGYVAELILLDWAEFLRQSAEPNEVLWTVDYYQRIDWIDETVADHLRTVVEGLATEPVAADSVDADGASLTIDHHTKSLEFISRLDGDPIDLDDLRVRSGE